VGGIKFKINGPLENDHYGGSHAEFAHQVALVKVYGAAQAYVFEFVSFAFLVRLQRFVEEYSDRTYICGTNCAVRKESMLPFSQINRSFVQNKQAGQPFSDPGIYGE